MLRQHPAGRSMGTSLGPHFQRSRPYWSADALADAKAGRVKVLPVRLGDDATDDAACARHRPTCSGQPRLASPNSPHDQCGHFAVREDFIGLAAEYQTP